MDNNASLPVVAGVQITVDSEGRYNLNALHKASGLGDEKRPGSWTRSQQAKDFIAEIISAEIFTVPLITVVGGSNPGTFAHKYIAFAYAAWLGGTDVLIQLFDSIQDVTIIINALHSFEVPDDLPDMYVYAIREKVTGNIKLGISRDPKKRLHQLQTGNSNELELVAYRRADNRFSDEKQLHHNAAQYLIHGEWFDSRALEVMQ